MDEFERLFRDYTPVVYRFLLSLCGDAGLAEELTDETFYQAYLHIGRFRGECKAEDPFAAIHDKSQALEIHIHLHSLSEPYREVFMLKVFGELTFREIADICGRTESWAKVTFYRAKNKLIESMEGRHEN